MVIVVKAAPYASVTVYVMTTAVTVGEVGAPSMSAVPE